MFISSKELSRLAEGFVPIYHISINSMCIYKAPNSGIIIIITAIIPITTSPVLLERHYLYVVVGLVCSEKDVRGSTILNRSHQESECLSHKKIW